jgi:phosphohistidine phosphatase
VDGVDLYLIRHAEAVAQGAGGATSDEERRLTEKGKQQAQTLSSGLRQRGVRLGAVVTSPLVRARQTAEGLLQQWPDAPELHECDELAPGGRKRKLARFLADLGVDAAAVVGHRPDLDEFAAWLIGDKTVGIRLAKAGVAYIRCDGDPAKGTGTLTWLVPPEWFEQPA